MTATKAGRVSVWDMALGDVVSTVHAGEGEVRSLPPYPRGRQCSPGSPPLLHARAR